MRTPILGVLLLAAAACAAAQQPSPIPPQPACPNGPTELPPAWSAWNAARPLAAVAAPDALDTARFAPGEAIDLALRPDPEIAYLSLPKGEGEAESFGGLAKVRIEHAGRYGVGVGAGVWIDLSRDGQPTATAMFGPGPVCSPVRKVVAFDLSPGDYVLEISGSKAPAVRVMIAEGGVPSPRE